MDLVTPVIVMSPFAAAAALAKAADLVAKKQGKDKPVEKGKK